MSRVLYYLEDSRAFRVAWALEELELDYELKHYRRIEGKRAEATLKSESGNPLGKSPYLVDSDVKLGESAAQVKYLIQRYAPESSLLGPANDWQKRGDVEAWISFSEGMMVHTLAAIYPRWFLDPSSAAQVEAKMTPNIQNNLNALEAALTGNDYLVGDSLTAADLMCVFSAEYTLYMDTGISSDGKKKQDWPNTLAWLMRCAQRPAYKRVLQKGATHKFTVTD